MPTQGAPALPFATPMHVDDHPLLDLRWLDVVHRATDAGPGDADFVRGWLTLEPAATLPGAFTRPPDAEVRAAVRDLLRHGGFKPTGRNKPSAEYLAAAAAAGRLGSIHPFVDLGNAVSLHSGLPISVVDLDRATGDLRVGIAAADAQYVFNAGGQAIDVGGLPCLHDADGPCANAVKDAHRTKVDPDRTRRVRVLVWGTRALADRVVATESWIRQLAEAAGYAVG